MRSRVDFGGPFWLLLVLAAVVAIWLWTDLMLVVVGGLSSLNQECLQSSVYAGGACGCMSAGGEDPGQQMEVSGKVCLVGG